MLQTINRYRLAVKTVSRYLTELFGGSFVVEYGDAATYLVETPRELTKAELSQLYKRRDDDDGYLYESDSDEIPDPATGTPREATPEIQTDEMKKESRTTISMAHPSTPSTQLPTTRYGSALNLAANFAALATVSGSSTGRIPKPRSNPSTKHLGLIERSIYLDTGEELRLKMRDGKAELEPENLISESLFSTVHSNDVYIPSLEGSTAPLKLALKQVKAGIYAHQVFDTEARALMRLREASVPTSSRIIHLLCLPIPEYRLFVFPLAESSLESFFSRGRKSPSSFADSIGNQFHPLLEGLQTCHDNGIYHGDIKPANILVFKNSDEIQFKLSDFSHCSFDESVTVPPERAGAYACNPEYSCPELFDQSQRVDLRLCDTWALGCVFLELVVFATSGDRGLERFRSLLVSKTDPVKLRFFHSNGKLKSFVTDQIQKALFKGHPYSDPDSDFGRILAVIPLLLQSSPTERLLAYQASEIFHRPPGSVSSSNGYLRHPERTQAVALNERLSSFQTAASVGVLAPFPIARTFVSSDLGPITSTAIFGIPIGGGLLIAALAYSAYLRRFVYDFVTHPAFPTLLIALTAAGVLKYSKSLIDFALSRVICPFGNCPVEKSEVLYRFPNGWYEHICREHSSSQLNYNGSGGSSIGGTQTPMSTSRISARTRGSRSETKGTQARDNSRSPVHYGPPGQNSHDTAAIRRCIDLCLPDMAFEELHQWKYVKFVPSWTDGSLFQCLCAAYTNNANAHYPRFWRMVSFKHLSSIRPYKFRLMMYQDLGQELRALCEKPASREDLIKLVASASLPEFEPKLTNASYQKLFGRLVRDTPPPANEDDLPTTAGAHAGATFVAEVEAIMRNKEPIPGLEYQGTGLQFVEKWNMKKLYLELVATTAVFIIMGIIVGSSAQSVEYGFLVGSLGVALTQLLVAILVIIAR